MKTYSKKPILKVSIYGTLIFCESFVPFEYQLMHSIVFQFVAKIIGLSVLFERLKFSVREADLHSTPE